MDARPLKRIDILRHELKALRFVLDHYHSADFERASVPPRDDFQAPQSRELYDVIMKASTRAEAEAEIAAMDLEEVDIDSFLRLSGEHYYTYPALVRERAAAIRQGRLTVEAA
ncbi:MAG: hypothetical protein ACREQE_00975 [Candidatus Binataceae bacterium]